MTLAQGFWQRCGNSSRRFLRAGKGEHGGTLVGIKKRGRFERIDAVSEVVNVAEKAELLKAGQSKRGAGLWRKEAAEAAFRDAKLALKEGRVPEGIPVCGGKFLVNLLGGADGVELGLIHCSLWIKWEILLGFAD